jgi:hypothetical protein
MPVHQRNAIPVINRITVNQQTRTTLPLDYRQIVSNVTLQTPVGSLPNSRIISNTSLLKGHMLPLHPIVSFATKGITLPLQIHVLDVTQQNITTQKILLMQLLSFPLIVKPVIQKLHGHLPHLNMMFNIFRFTLASTRVNGVNVPNAIPSHPITPFFHALFVTNIIKRIWIKSIQAELVMYIIVLTVLHVIPEGIN